MPRINPKLLTALALGGGAGAGGLFGRHVTPRIFGYEDDEAARNLSTLIDAAAGAGIAALARNPSAARKLLQRPTSIPSAVGGIAASEVLPMGVHALGEGTSAAESLSRSRILDQLQEAVGTPEGKGAAIGAAGAGLGALASGLLRPRTRTELEGDRTRTGMVASDFLKFVIPAMLAGGIAGHASGGE